MKKIQLALAISMILAAQSVWAASTADIINIQQAKGTANFDNIQATATGGTQTINIYQASSGAGSTDMGSATSLIATAPTPPNANDSNQVSLLVNGTTGSSTVKIGQGYYNNSGTWTASQTGGTTNNVVYGTVTKEPCPMCAGAVVHTRLARVVFGAGDPKGGAAGGAMNLLQFPTLNHRCDITAGVRLEECRALLQSFFAEQRAAAKARPEN